MKKRKTANGFTVIELLVVIGILGILAAILLPALAKARVAASELRSESDLRQMLLGYTMYYQDNSGAVLLGYTPNTLNGSPVSVTDPSSGQSFGAPVANRYPWRLLPYVANMWRILHSYESTPSVPAPGDSADVVFQKAYNLSLSPTYGINSIYVGGDANYGGFGMGSTGDQPNDNRYIVFRATQVRDTSRLIVFTDCRCYNVPGMANEGLYNVMPPRANGLQWTVSNGQCQFTHPYSVIGAPQGWYSQRVTVGFFDGHVEMMQPSDLQDMRLWANWADSRDYDYAP